MSQQDANAERVELKSLVDRFFDAVSFEVGSTPTYERIHGLFVDSGLLIKASGVIPEVSNVAHFIEPRQALVDSGDLTRFHEAELTSATEVFGRVAHRWGGYVKSGTLKGVPFEARGLISTQFVQTQAGWKISCMAWDDERPGLQVPEKYR